MTCLPSIVARLRLEMPRTVGPLLNTIQETVYAIAREVLAGLSLMMNVCCTIAKWTVAKISPYYIDPSTHTPYICLKSALNRIRPSPHKPLELKDRLIELRNGVDVVILKEDNFRGDGPAAMKYLRGFIQNPENNVRIYPAGYGYETLYVNEQAHDYSHGAISIETMLRLCGDKSAADFPYQPE